VLVVAASLEQASEHPLARAILDRVREDGLALRPVAAFTAHPGSGVSGEVDGRRLLLGSADWLSGEGLSPDFAIVEQLAAQGSTVVTLGRGKEVIGYIAIADRLRATSTAAVTRLRHQGVEPVMLTGDNPATAAHIAEQAGIGRFQAHVLPADKAATVRQLGGHGLVGMAGDGINDAPALAAADVSFALASGSDIAVEAADVTLMRNDLNGVADAISLSRATVRKIKQNLFFAFIYNVLGIPLAAAGMLNPVVAGAAMALSSVSVVSNSLLLRRWKPGH
jgi:Cu+-exporting ATPase